MLLLLTSLICSLSLMQVIRHRELVMGSRHQQLMVLSAQEALGLHMESTEGRVTFRRVQLPQLVEAHTWVDQHMVLLLPMVQVEVLV
jgi:hypothetical protein